MLALVAIGAGMQVRLPYYSVGPGSIRATESLIDLDDGPRDEAPGSFSFATVTVNGRLRVTELVDAWLRPSVDVVPEDRILQGRSPNQNRRANQELMDGSKELAVEVALVRLGLSTPFGAVVAAVEEGSPAAGVLTIGDVVSGIDGSPVRGSGELVAAIRARTPGTEVRLTVLPGAADADGTGTPGRAAAAPGVERRLTLMEGDPGVAFLGVSVRTAFDLSYPHDIDIDSGQVGGPSAGLAFTLGILDLITPGDLAGGRHVAVTGTINPDGSVGAIGGVQQKAAAARAAGVDLLLVPAGQAASELERARALAGDGLEVVTVHTLDEALAELAARGGEPLTAAAPSA